MTRSPSPSRFARAFGAGVAVVWTLLHLRYFLHPAGHVNGDAAVVSLQAFAMARGHYLPIFMAGQNYMGVAPVWLGALLTRAFGAHLGLQMVAWAVPSALAFGVIAAALARYVHWGAAVLWVALLCVLPGQLLTDSIFPAGHVMGILGAALVLAWLLRWMTEPASWTMVDTWWAGLCAGFFWYADELVLPSLAVGAVVLGTRLWKARRRSLPGHAALLAAGFLVGYAPALWYVAQGHRLTLHRGHATLAQMVTHAHLLVDSLAWGFWDTYTASPELKAFTLLASLSILVLFGLYARLGAKPWQRWTLPAIVAMNAVVYVASSAPLDIYSVRYLYPGIYTLLAMLAILLAQLARRMRGLSVLPVIMASTMILLGAGIIPASTVISPVAYHQQERLASWLVEHHLRDGWGDYWTVYLMDAMAWPHLDLAASTNLAVPVVVARALAACRRGKPCVVVNSGPARPGTPVPYWPPAAGGTLVYGRQVKHMGAYVVYRAADW